MTKREKRKMYTEEIFENYKRIKDIDLKIQSLQSDKELLQVYNEFLEDMIKIINSNEIKEIEYNE